MEDVAPSIRAYEKAMGRAWPAAAGFGRLGGSHSNALFCCNRRRYSLRPEVLRVARI